MAFIFRRPGNGAALRVLTLLLLVWPGWLAGQAATAPLIFTRLGTGLDDFPYEGFACALKGRFGLMWFGNARGLLRYDGSSTRWYRHEPGNPSSLPPGNVRTLFEDQKGDFWVGTHGGLARLNRRLGTFEHFPIAAQAPPTANNIWSLGEDASGTLLVGTAAGLFTRAHQELTPVPIAWQAPQEGVTSMVADSRGRLWFGTEKSGVFRQNKPGEQLEQLPNLAGKKISAMVLGAAQELWIATYDEGVFVLDPTGTLTQHFHADAADFRQLESNRVRSLARDAFDRIWIGSDQGLYRYFPQSRRLEAFKHEPGRLQSLRANDIQFVYASEPGLLWVATAAAGLDLLNLEQEAINTHPLAGNGCLAIARLESGPILAGTRAGLAMYDPATETTQWRLREQTVRAIHVASPNEIFVGTGQGLFAIQPRGEADADAHVAYSGRIWSIVADGSGTLWLATDTGLVRYRPQDGELYEYPVDASASHALNYPVATSLALDATEHLWIGTFGGGVNRLHLPSQTFAHFHKESPAPSGLLADDVVDLHTDRSGGVWAATLSGGLHRYDRQREVFEAVALPSQHHDLTPVAITSDDEGSLWLNTGAGLLHLDPETRQFRRIRLLDGLQTGSALPGSLYFAAATGEILVGGIEGMSRLAVKDFSESQPAPLIFTSFKAGQKEIRHLMLPGESVQLARDQRSFSLQFAVLDYLSAQEQVFAYKRQNIDEDWVFSTTSGEVNYTNLGGLGGSHRLQIKGSAGRGFWQEASFITEVEAPLWWTWLPLILAAAIALLIFLTYRLVSWRESRKRRALEAKAQLAEQRQALAESSADIAEKEKLLERKERQFQEEHASVVQTYLERRATEIANDLHDGPLGALHGVGFSLNQLSQKLEPGPVHDSLAQVYHQRLPKICQQLRDLCGDLLTPDFSDGLLAELSLLADHMESQQPNLTITRNFSTDLPQLTQDQKAVIFRIFRILLNNVEKHAAATQVQLTIACQQAQLQLMVIDNGRGFTVPPDWEHFKQQNHFGLYMVAYFARMMGGTFKVTSSSGAGSHFTVTLPLPK